ncbi:MAG TPA: type II secretion system protein [Firmicutes bacterium]|nr:type II secretion system protein [Bacillota bacterium]
MKMQPIKQGMTLIEMIVTLALFGVISTGVLAAYLLASRQTNQAMLKSETVTVARIAMDTLLRDIQRAKNVTWADPVLTVTLYNDVTVTYTTVNTAEGPRLHRNGNNVVASDYADISLVTTPAPVIDPVDREVTLSVRVTVTRGSQSEDSLFTLTGTWRNV